MVSFNKYCQIEYLSILFLNIPLKEGFLFVLFCNFFEWKLKCYSLLIKFDLLVKYTLLALSHNTKHSLCSQVLNLHLEPWNYYQSWKHNKQASNIHYWETKIENERGRGREKEGGERGRKEEEQRWRKAHKRPLFHQLINDRIPCYISLKCGNLKTSVFLNVMFKLTSISFLQLFELVNIITRGIMIPLGYLCK